MGSKIEGEAFFVAFAQKDANALWQILLIRVTSTHATTTRMRVNLEAVDLGPDGVKQLRKSLLDCLLQRHQARCYVRGEVHA